jgi:2-oxoglutarate ferredoxin oxidoreductase subunit delta
MRGTILINESRCKGCELCVSVCPKGIIHTADYFTSRGYRPAVLVDPEGACTGCLLCSTVCPDAGITVYREVPNRKATATAPTPVTASS